MEQAEQLEYHILKSYQYLSKIGKGTYGVVYKAKHKKTQRIVAIKKIIDAFQNLIDAKRTYRELNYLLQMSHPCIVKLQTILHLNKKGPFRQTSTTRLAVPTFAQQKCGSNTDKLFSKGFSQQRHVYAVFQFMETDLSCALQKYPKFQPLQRKYIAYQLLHGIAFMHRSGLVHRDIKPSNILLDCNSLAIKICDFGMARMKITNQANNEGVLTEYVASRWYRPPQALLGVTTCQDAIDLWSVGCVLAELILKQPLFQGKSTLNQIQIILRCIGMPSVEEIQRIPSEQAQYVLRNFTFSKKSKFCSLQQSLKQGCRQQIDLIMSLLTFEPSRRTTASDALQHEYFNQIKLMENSLQKYKDSSIKLMDLSTANRCPQSEDRSNNRSGIDYYRKLVEELQKFADCSSNKSGFTNQAEQSPNIAINQQICNSQHQNNSVKFKQKSTKQSDFVSINKHHYLHPASMAHQQLTAQITNQRKSEQQSYIKDENISIVVKKAVQQSKEIQYIPYNQHLSQKIQNSLQKKVVKTSVKKIAKGSQDKRNVKKQVQLREQLHPPKNIYNDFQKKSQPSLKINNKIKYIPKNQTLYSHHQKRKAISQAQVPKSKKNYGINANNSMVKNHSTVSLKSQSINSYQKSKHKQQKSQQLISTKEENIKRLIKRSNASTKHPLTKCTSAKMVNPFKRKI